MVKFGKLFQVFGGALIVGLIVLIFYSAIIGLMIIGGSIFASVILYLVELILLTVDRKKGPKVTRED